MTALGNKQIMADNLSFYMKKNKIDRNQLCEALDFKYSTVSEWLSAKKYPRIDNIEKMALFFNIPKSKLIEKNDPEPSNISNVIPAENLHMIPVFASVSAGFGAYASDEILEYIPTVLTNPYEANITLGIKVTGNSMYPKIEDGDTIVVRKQESVDSGSIAVILLDGEEGLVKKVKYGPDWIDLISINPEYPVKHFEGSEVQRLRVVGLVRQVIKMV